MTKAALNSVEKCECFVTHRMNKGPAFAVRSDNGEAVFVGAKVARSQDLQPFDIVELIVIPNKHEPHRTPWYSIRARIISRAVSS